MLRRVGRPTRGKTAPERLRRTDVLADLLGVPPRDAPIMVDVGYGADSVTTLESWRRLRARLGDDVRVIGVEIDRERVDAAQADARPGTLEFRLGGLDLPLAADERGRVGWIRAMNVLRQYPPEEHADAVARMTRELAPDGRLLEGTSSPSGRLLTVNVFGPPREWRGLVLAPNPRRDWAPRELQTVLPKNFIHECGPGSDLERFFAHWEQLHRRALGFSATARALHDAGYDVDLRPAFLRRGILGSRGITPSSARAPRG